MASTFPFSQPETGNSFSHSHEFRLKSLKIRQLAGAKPQQDHVNIIKALSKSLMRLGKTFPIRIFPISLSPFSL